MHTDDLKKAFIHLMEKSHQNLLFPKNFFGCLMAIFIDQQPITQDRIIELTGYSKTTISQSLNLIQMNFPINKIKKPKIRKKFYSISSPPRNFMLDVFKLIIKSYEGKVDFLLPLIDDVSPYILFHLNWKTHR